MAPPCVRGIAEELGTWQAWLREVLAKPDFAAEPIGAATTILSNVAHVFVYLEGNRKYLDYGSLLPWRDQLLDGAETRQAVLNLLSTRQSTDPDQEDMRQRWVARLRELVDSADPDLDRREGELYAAVERITGELERERITLLRRLGVGPSPGAGPDAMFFRLNGSAASPDVRTKLALAWKRPRARWFDEAADLFDRLLEVRRERARRCGFSTPLHETLSRCSISEGDMESFADEYLRQAVAGHERLGSEIRAATGCADDPMNHFAYYLRGRTAGEQLPTVPLLGCLDVIRDVAWKALGVTVHPDDGSSSTALTLPVHAGARLAGRIRIDLLGPRAAHREASTRDGSLLPVGRVLCRYQESDGERVLTFDSAHSLFHELGHALTQVLVRTRRPGPSGLEYLPVERLEDLSLWFEKWVYHPDFASRVAPTADLERGLLVCQRVKMLEFLGTQLQRAVVAALDFDVHRRTTGGFRESFQRLDAEHGIGRYCDLGEVLWTFAWPMYRANPGLGVTYLWGGAYGAERFLPFLGTRLADLPAAEVVAFRSCFDSDVPSTRPDIGAVPRFYERALLEAPAG